MRRKVLGMFGVDESTHSVVFTSGATGALRLVGESFGWIKGSSRLLLYRNVHNSLLGVREYAKQNGCSWSTVPHADLHNWRERLQGEGPHLLGLTGECNFSGRKFDLERLCKREKGDNCFVLLDAAALVPSSPLDLSRVSADFVCFSFYKMWGLPSGLGALIVRNSSASMLRKTYFGGGTVLAAVADEDYIELRQGVSERLEDGTIPFLSICTALDFPLQRLDRLTWVGVEKHTFFLARKLFLGLSALTHANGSKVVEVYGNWNDPLCSRETQGPIVCFNVKTAEGGYIGYSTVARLGGFCSLLLRTGCFCNPGACQEFLGLSSENVKANFKEGHVCWDDKDLIGGRPTGAVRFSLGYCSTVRDVDKAVQFVEDYFCVKEEEKRGESNAGDIDGTLLRVFVYPIKSCAGFEVKSWDIGDYGLAYDREWVLMNEKGEFLNQKKLPKMCQIKANIDKEKRQLVVRAEGVEEELVIPLSLFPTKTVPVTVCGDDCGGLDYETDRINGWFSSFLDTTCQLVRLGKESERMTQIEKRRFFEQRDRVSESHEKLVRKTKISFANEAQFLIISQEKMDELNAKLKERKDLKHTDLSSVEVERFRPNFVVSSLGEQVLKFRIGKQAFYSCGPCRRCEMVCINQDTLERTREPLRTLASFSRKKSKIVFGSLWAHAKDESEGPLQVCVGDRLQ